MNSCYRYCNHCGTEFFNARDWVEHTVKVAKGFGHKDATWVRHIAAGERKLLGEVEFERILKQGGLA